MRSSSSLCLARRAGAVAASAGDDPPRYYYEDGRGNKVWVQNLTLDYDVRRLHRRWGEGAGGWQGEGRLRPRGVPRQPPRRRASLHRQPPPARGVSTWRGSQRVTDQQQHGPSYGAQTPPTRCTCDCPVHAVAVAAAKRSVAAAVFPQGAGVQWTFIPEASLAGVIRTVDDAEFILARLRSEEHILRRAYVR
ncbi:hypothetical protein TraAM80_08387 [Trypanosoma rangeli]|uniref:Uncharacterized protein n=1 Tax=Trypanosoma rangeli TaxID=5698 RepID=A0A422N1B2_TRYRA|nr:uncharacterized protein TraAM80_08387 [Trypanosoma rangeli]RNE99247.1 hypothetical protein TraAM80_08387 [Trypanosoma rangeli]|eukprot:RNE99247.1 hypothetical protein TraAM80_08387 [Trypanosoma rangeli]